MKLLKQVLIIFSVILNVFMAGACGNITEDPTVMASTVENITPSTPLVTSSPMNSIPRTATSNSLPGCTALPKGYIHVVDYSTYINVDAGLELGVREAVDILQQALEDHHPEWAQQAGLAQYIWDHSGAQMIGVNPRVLLVTAGVALNWQVPEDHDLREDVVQAGVALTQHYRAFHFNENLQAQYPQVADASTYALFAFFDYDLEKFNSWQQEYDQMFGELQPRITVDNC